MASTKMTSISFNKNSLNLSIKNSVIKQNDSIKIVKENTNKIENLQSVQLTDKNKPLKMTKEKISQLLRQSTAHGIPNMLRASSFLLKSMWLIFVIISTCTCLYFTIKSIQDYFKYSTVTTIKEINEKYSQFPTISICAYPRFSLSIDENIISASYESVDFLNFSRVFEEFNDSFYGKCYRINSGKNIYNEKIDLLNSTMSGYPSRLKIKFFLEDSNEEIYRELLINIHNHSSPPYDMENKGYWIRTGSWNFYEVERIFTERLSEPYNDCLKDINLFKQNKTIINYIHESNRTYSQMDCYYVCSKLFALEENHCKCNSTLMDFEEDCVRHFYEQDKVPVCIAEYLLNFRKKLQHERCAQYCPLECDSISYSISTYLETMPANGNLTTKRKTEYGLERFDTYEQINRNFAYIAVYYNHLKYTLVTQDPKTETFNFISYIGGILGLFLGISFLSFIEIFEMVLEVVFIIFRNN